MTPISPGAVIQGTTDGAELSGYDGFLRNRNLRILVVDDCRLRRESVTGFFAKSAGEVGSAWDLDSLSTEFERCRPDVILMNMATPGAPVLLQRCVQLCPASRVVAFGLSEDDEETVVACVEAGVGGYHLRSESLEDLTILINKVLKGDVACSPRVSAILLRRVSELASQRTVTSDALLTAREEEVLRMLAMGLSNREIASRLCIAVHTVKNHVHNLLTKLGARSRAEAVALYRGNVRVQG